MAFHLMRPEWLWCLLPALLLAALLWRARGRSGSWNDVIAPELLPYLVGGGTGGRSVNLLPLVFIGWVLAALAASGPSWQKIPQPIHQKQDALVLVLDLSYSMKSGDLAPSRLDRARQKLLDLLEQRREGQTGLIAFAGDAHIVTPLTDDTPTIANLLPALNPDMMPVPGSDSAAAVAQAVELLHSAGIRQGRILLVTDGVAGKDHKKLQKAITGSGAQLSIMGVGTKTGAPIPLPRGGFLKDNSGTIVMPGLDEQELRSLADDTGGRYRRMQIDDSDLDALLAETVLADTGQTMSLDRTADTWDDQGYLFVLVLLPLVLGLFRRGWVLCLMPLLFLQPQPASAQSWNDLWLTADQQGQRALQQGDHEAATELFANPEWAGTAAYQGGDYEAASDLFSASEGANSWYNRGNALARAGQLDEAIAAYQESLKLQPDQADARENLELLEQMKQQQEQQQQNQQNNEDQNQEQDQDKDQDQDQSQQDQQQGDQEQEQEQDQQQQSDQNSDSQQNPDQEQQESEQQPGSEQQDSEQQEQEEQEQEQQPQEGETDEQEQQAQAAQADPEAQERDQAMEQWLRRIPDDPSGLLREKFRYESRQRQEQGARRENESYW